MNYHKRLPIVLLIILSCVGCDQASKAAAHRYLMYAAPASYFHDMLRIQYTENPGAFLSLGAALPAEARFWLLVVLTGAAVLGAFAYILVRNTLHPGAVASISLIIGGGVGNLIDRVRNDGAVIDFMNLGIGWLRTGIFNVADVEIMIGVGILLYFSFKGMERESPS